jgi:hypothetical protein
MKINNCIIIVGPSSTLEFTADETRHMDGNIVLNGSKYVAATHNELKLPFGNSAGLAKSDTAAK